MTQEDKKLLLADLCARLPYRVKYQDRIDKEVLTLTLGIIHHYERFIPYLRPMSSMTEEEKETYESFIIGIAADEIGAWELTDWLNEHHFDYRGLIEKGLAIKAPEGMYEIK